MATSIKSPHSVWFYKTILVVLHVALGVIAIGGIVYKKLLIDARGVWLGLDKIDISFEAVVLFLAVLWPCLLVVSEFIMG